MSGLSGPVAPLFIPWIDYLIGGGCSGQRICLAQGHESFIHLAGVTCARTHLSCSLLGPVAAPSLLAASAFLVFKGKTPFSLIPVCLMNVSPGPHPIPPHPGDAPTYLGRIGKHLELAQETQDWSFQTHLKNFGGFEPASPPCWLLHHLESTHLYLLEPSGMFLHLLGAPSRSC